MKRIISLLFLLLIIFIGCTPEPPKPDIDEGTGTEAPRDNNNGQPTKQDANVVVGEETEPDNSDEPSTEPNTTESVGKEEIHDYIVQGYQFASASNGTVKGVVSPTMEIVQDGGNFEKLVVETTENQEKGSEEKDEELKDTLSLLSLAPGDFLDCRFKLPETAFDVKATIVYKGQDEGIKGRIRWNKTLLPEDQAVLLKVDKSELAAGTGLTQKVIPLPLEKFQRENELRIFSLGELLQILNVKITYSYRLPCCTVGNVMVKLLSPDSDKDVLTPDLTLKWTRTGLCDNGRIIFKYKDGEEWKTVPGTEPFDIGDDAWEDKTSDTFVWKNHGLKEFPKLKIVYSEDESPKHRETPIDTEAKPNQKLPSPEEQMAGRFIKKINGVEFAFRWCPANKFMMGSPENELGRSDDEIQHEVTLTNGFWIMETEVTQRQWKAVMRDNPSNFKGDDLPVEQVSWNACQEFCKKCTQQHGLPVSLPTEAQWEYACRAGTKGFFAGNLDDMAWYKSNSDGKTHLVSFHFLKNDF